MKAWRGFKNYLLKLISMLGISDFVLDNSTWVAMRKTKIIAASKKWREVGISWWIHGNEHYGVQVVHDYLQRLQSWELELIRWQISLILAGNEEALRQNKRWVSPWNKGDLNRLIDKDAIPEEDREDSYEQRRGGEIKKLINTRGPESWLDLHSFSAKKGKPYAFSSLHGFEAVWEDLGIQNIAINMGNANNDANEWVTLWSGVADYVNARGANGFTFEAWNHNDLNCFLATYQALVNFLVAHEMMKPKKVRTHWVDIFFDDQSDIVPIGWKESMHVHVEYRHSHLNEMWSSFKYNGDTPESFSGYKEGEVIWCDIHADGSREDVKARFDGYIILPKSPSICTPWNEVFYFWKSMPNNPTYSI